VNKSGIHKYRLFGARQEDKNAKQIHSSPLKIEYLCKNYGYE